MELNASTQAAQLFRAIGEEDQEVVHAAFLKTNHELIAVREIFRGTILESPAQPREILREALKCNAASYVVAHNHPSGEIWPSEKDLRFTVRLEWASEVVGIALVDHLIIGREGGYFSFAEARLLGRSFGRPWRRRCGRPPRNRDPYFGNNGSRLPVSRQ
jgi:DNA repair protein RadC